MTGHKELQVTECLVAKYVKQVKKVRLPIYTENNEVEPTFIFKGVIIEYLEVLSRVHSGGGPSEGSTGCLVQFTRTIPGGCRYYEVDSVKNK